MVKQRVEESHHLETTKPRIGNYAGQNFVKPKFSIIDTDLTEPSADEADDEDDDSTSWYSAESSSSVLDSRDVIAFRAYTGSVIGRFIVYANGIRFVRSANKEELWRRTWLELAEMRKLDASSLSRVMLKGLEQLEITFTDGSSVFLEAMKDRDEAFNTIIGFSALQWQVSLCKVWIPQFRYGKANYDGSLYNTVLETKARVEAIDSQSRKQDDHRAFCAFRERSALDREIPRLSK